MIIPTYLMSHSFTTPLLLLTLILTFTYKSECATFCMQTYKVNCSICFDNSTDSQNFVSCTFKNGTSLTSLNSSQCLPKCCPSFSSGADYSSQNVNRCFQRDAQVNDINIGLSMGLILSLLFVLSMLGLAYELYQFCEWADSSTSSHKTVSQQGIATDRLNTGPKSDDLWFSDGLVVSGNCLLCYKGGINIVGDCQHGFHYTCLSRTIQNKEQVCPICQRSQSLRMAKIYCSGCHQKYKVFDSEKEQLDLQAAQAMREIKCNQCEGRIN